MRACVSKEADIAAGALTVTDRRRQFFDFTEPFLSLRSSALIRRPLASPPPSHSHHDRRRRRRSTTTARPSTSPPPPPTQRIRTAAELLASDLSYGVVSGSVVERAMSTSMDTLTRALWSRVATFWPPALVDSVQEGVERARREPYAFIVDSPMAAYVAGRRPCDLYVTEPFLDRMSYAFAVRQGATRLRATVDRELRRARSSGQLQAMYLQWWRDECTSDIGDLDVHIPSTTKTDAVSQVGRYRPSMTSNLSRTTSRHLLLTTIVSMLWTLCQFIVASSS